MVFVGIQLTMTYSTSICQESKPVYTHLGADLSYILCHFFIKRSLEQIASTVSELAGNCENKRSDNFLYFKFMITILKVYYCWHSYALCLNTRCK